ncbi:MAG: tryptophan-rich sensory protein [Clostridiales bacterium]|nr:tryptophan-rich sensory protein [Clostridiales bacterium]
MDRVKKAWINLICLVVTLALNTLGALGVINGLSQKEISDMYVTLITPSPATFSIWSVIYSLLLISVIVMLVKKKDSYFQNALDKISVLFWFSCLFNVAWIVLFSFVQLELSVIFILAFVVTLSFICMKLLDIQDRRRRLLPISFGIYTGWLFIAAVVNIAAMLVKLEWNGFGIAPQIWGIIMLIIAVLLVIYVLLKNRNAAFPLPIAWAYLGIYQFLHSPEGFNNQYRLLQAIALIGMAVLIGAAAIQFYRNRYSVLPVRDNTPPSGV